MSDVANELNAAESVALSNLPVAEHVVSGVAATVGGSLGSQIDVALSKVEAVTAFVEKHKSTIEMLTNAAQNGSLEKAPLMTLGRALFSSIL